MDELPIGPCPCGSGATFERCCAPILQAPHDAVTAEALMRSRYVAHVVGNVEHLAATWHPRTRPTELALEPRQQWLGLTIKRTEAGSADDDHGIVEYVARFKIDGRGHRLHEVSRFEKLRGAWIYVDGELVERGRKGGKSAPKGAARR